MKGLDYWYRTTENKNELKMLFWNRYQSSVVFVHCVYVHCVFILNPMQYFLCISESMAICS